MLRLIVASAAALLVFGAGIARADDCSPEGVAESMRAPVVVVGGLPLVLGSRFTDLSGEGRLDDGVAERFVLGDPHPTVFSPPERAVSPSLVGTSVVEWAKGGAIVEAGDDARVLIAHVPFPGYHGVAAAAGPDGTITLIYGTTLRRIATDGALGEPVTLPVSGPTLSPRIAVDAQGTAFAVLRGEGGGVAVRWPAAGDPQVTPSPALVQPGLEDAPSTVVPDDHGGAWFRVLAGRRLSLLHITDAGATTAPVASGVLASTDPLPDGRIAWSDRTHALLAGRSLGAGTVESLALDPRTHRASVLLARDEALVLAGGRSLKLRERRGYDQTGGSLAFGPDGRGWAVWDEASVKTDAECHEFPAHASVRWAALARGVRHPAIHVLKGAPPAFG